MKHFAPLALALSLTTPAIAQDGAGSNALATVAPALQGYSDIVMNDQLWQRTQLAPRDRSIVTISALIARTHTADLQAEIERALANGVAPAEISEILTHLAFYAGWGTAKLAAPIVEAAFAAQNVDTTGLPGLGVDLLEQNAEGEATRVEAVDSMLAGTSPGLAEFTTDPLFSEIWLRPGLAPRDRSLVTITSLIALGQTAQLAGHLNRALDNGLTGDEAGEVVSHLAFYSGWPTAFSAGPVVKDVLESRSE